MVNVLSPVSETGQHRSRPGVMMRPMPRNHKKGERESARTTRASVLEEMAKPRTSKSARIKELNLDTARSREQPSASVPGTVDKIIPSGQARRPEKAQIAVDGAKHGDGDFRIENTLTDEHGDDVRLKKGGHVEVTVTAKNDNQRS
jgi:hypothetical protein